MHQDQTPDATASADAADMDAAILQAELDQLRVAHDSLREEILRERAELENQRRRLIRDVEQARRFANERLLSDLLPVFDSLDAGLNAAANQSGPLKDGLELTQRQLIKMAGEHGIVVI
ncbi:MAG TPA: nucleotide exchange factor GrpE, partial [Arenimonas sp.]|nr:nucleotide exchange factor GrpE [Arenimonas sp.]